jgi:hypothetical protein
MDKTACSWANEMRVGFGMGVMDETTWSRVEACVQRYPLSNA